MCGPMLWTNASEGDLMVWLHCIHSEGSKILIFSRDTDVYHIGLTVARLILEKHIIVQLSKQITKDPKFINLNDLIRCLTEDPDLHGIPSQYQPQTLQSLYVCTGCDYTSFFVGMGKVSFLSTFFQYASFIAGGTDPAGSIGNITINKECTSFLSFLRLVGCAYFRLHSSAFEYSSPVTLYHSVAESNTHEHHCKWMDIVRKTVWLRADKESSNMPSTTALKLHWLRCLWVLNMWRGATQNELELPGIHMHVCIHMYTVTHIHTHTLFNHAWM